LKKIRKIVKRLLWTGIIIFIMMNVIAIFHSYKFTHFADRDIAKTKDPQELSTVQKIGTLIFGIDNPRPVNDNTPSVAYETLFLKGDKKIECWNIKVPQAKGTVILFHGYGGHKSNMLDKAEVFREQGFNTLLVDFMGSGASEGNQTTIGFYESEQVKTAFSYLTSIGEKNVYLFGTSMGSVAIMKAVSEYTIQPTGIILECPFGSMYKTVSARFRIMNTPTFPMAGLLVFWGGVQNGFWAFGHNPSEYSKQILCPTLLLYGQQDDKVSQAEIDEIFENLGGQKELKIYPNAGHENYLIQYKEKWTDDIGQFITANKSE